MVHLNKVNGEDTVILSQNDTPVVTQKTQGEKVVLFDQKNKDKKPEDADKLPQGYRIEQTSSTAVPDTGTQAEDDDALDTSVNPNARITLNPSIAIYKETSEITDAMKQTVERAVASTLHDSGKTDYYKATDMLKNRQPYNCFDDINFTKNFNIYGKAAYEAANFSFTTNTPSRIERQENSIKTDLGFNYKSKSENTKAMLFSSFTKTNTNTHFTPSSAENGENQEIEVELNYKSYSLYGALQQRFKNNDMGTLSAYHINDAAQESKTSNVTASYFLNKYMAMAQGSLSTYKVYNQKAITKLDFNISFNPESASPDLKAKDASEQNAETEAEQEAETKVTSETTNKKWSKSFSPFFVTQTINGSSEEGIGGQMRFKRIGGNSSFRVGAFGKVSTTQQEENNKYHVTFGSGIKYKKNLNAQSQLSANIDLKDRITFGEGNIVTADATLGYISPKVSAEIEGKYINTTRAYSPNYTGVVGRVFYMPNKNVNLFAEASYTDMKELDIRTSGSNIQAGVIVNF